MSELNTGPAPELNSPEGTQNQPQLTPEQQTAPAAPQPSIEELQQRATQAEKRFTDTQQAYTQSQQELSRVRAIANQLAGNQLQQPSAPPDPISGLVERFGKTFNPDHVRAIGSMVQELTGDLRQQNAALQQQVQVAQQASGIDYTIQQAAAMAPGLFTTQEDYQVARDAAVAHLRSGGQLDARFLVSVANDNRFWKGINNPTPATPAAPQVQPPNPLAGGMFRVTPGLTPQFPVAQKPQGAQTSEGQAFEQYFKTRYGPK